MDSFLGSLVSAVTNVKNAISPPPVPKDANRLGAVEAAFERALNSKEYEYDHRSREAIDNIVRDISKNSEFRRAFSNDNPEKLAEGVAKVIDKLDRNKAGLSPRNKADYQAPSIAGVVKESLLEMAANSLESRGVDTEEFKGLMEKASNKTSAAIGYALDAVVGDRTPSEREAVEAIRQEHQDAKMQKIVQKYAETANAAWERYDEARANGESHESAAATALSGSHHSENPHAPDPALRSWTDKATAGELGGGKSGGRDGR